MKRTVICVICLVILMSGSTARAEGIIFSDVPEDSWAMEYITRADELGIMGGYGSGVFGYGRSLKRAEFAAMLPRLFQWTLVNPETPAFLDNENKSAWYYDDIETALYYGAITSDSNTFRPDDRITREEMAEMLVRGLGYSTLAESLKNVKLPFADVTNNAAYIAMAYDFGIIGGTTDTTFEPQNNATREQAAAMMIRLYDRYFSNVEWSHAYYAISSYKQRHLISDFDAVSFGWSRLELTDTGTLLLNTTSSNGNSHSQPADYQEILGVTHNGGVADNLNVYMSASQATTLPDGSVLNACRTILTDSSRRAEVIALIVNELTHENAYTGVTIDFEEMRGTALREGLNLFLQELKAETDKFGFALYVCVPPVTTDGIYYDGYDYRTIGNLADKVILMAHDYAAGSLTATEMSAGYTTTPVSPIYEIYTALQAITDPKTGVVDKSKIALAISFDCVQWKLSGGKVVNASAYHPDAALLYSRMLDPAVELGYSVKFQNPYLKYYNDVDKTDNIGWYEDSRSVGAKMDLARMFGVTGISFWRLGLVPTYEDPQDRPIYYDIPAWLADYK